VPQREQKRPVTTAPQVAQRVPGMSDWSGGWSMKAQT
jgi:hypothetical protein